MAEPARADPPAGRGRPLRALALVLGGWIAIRVAWLWPAAIPPLAPRLAAQPVRAERMPVAAEPPGEPSLPPRRAVAFARGGSAPGVSTATSSPDASFPPTAVAPTTDGPPAMKPSGAKHVLALLGLVRYGTAEPAPPGPSRWSGSAWAIVRGDGPAGGVATPQLGGSQAGLRLAYALGDRLAVAARVAGALSTRQQEAALGIEWRPARALPLRVVAEQRIGVANARGGPALRVVGGVGDVAVPLGLALDGYVQAGVIARDGGEGYADGAVRVGRRMGRMDLSLGAWGAAQRGASRLDVGPSVAAVLPLAAARTVRVSLDWRARVAGDARPASGLALSLGTDF